MKKSLQEKVPEAIFYREKCLRAFFVDGCHGNDEIRMHTNIHLHVYHSWQV